MYSIQELRALRDKFPGDPNQDLVRKLIFSHLDQAHLLEGTKAESLLAIDEIIRLRNVLQALKNQAEGALT
jgi:hypothetical protein